ncbi:hypothetical protein BGZ72_001708, partial [Mortierella alpina]
MNSECAAHTVFAIPELALTVFAFVPRRDLPQCTRVCKQWHQLVEPLLWAHFCPQLVPCDPLPPQATKALIRNLPHIRSIELKINEYKIFAPLTLRLKPGISARVASRLCTNLRRLKFQCYYNDRHSKFAPILKLLNHNLQLTHLTLPAIPLFMQDTLFTAISTLKHLQYLKLESIQLYSGPPHDPYIGARIGLPLLQACLPLPKLTELLLDFDMVWRDSDTSDLETIIQEAASSRFSQNPTASKVKSLRLPTCYKGGRTPLPILLPKSRLLDLESCTIPWFSVDTLPQDIENIVREHCPRLRQVSCQSRRDDTQDAVLVCAFIRGCSGLQSFVSERFNNRSREFFYGQEVVPSLEPQSIITELISYHHNTLEDFELKEHCYVESEDLQAILSRCKQLKRFSVGDRYEANRPSLDFIDMARSDWVCMGLRELCLTFNRYGVLEDIYLSPKQGVQASKRIYTQIGRLHKLEVLALHVNYYQDDRPGLRKRGCSWDLTLSKGWLGEWAGLKSLKTIRLYTDIWSKMGQAEMEFMHEHWPLLREIRLHGHQASLLST